MKSQKVSQVPGSNVKPTSAYAKEEVTNYSFYQADERSKPMYISYETLNSTKQENSGKDA